MNLGILLWNTCNLECDHCAVYSGPREIAYMSDDEIFHLIDSTFHDNKKPSIGLSGGEAFINYKRLKRIVKYATDKGARISINTNGFWGTTTKRAEHVVRELIELNVTKIVVSIDDFHEDFLEAHKPVNVIKACRKLHLEVDLQFVSSKKSKRLSDFLARFGDDLMNISCREIPIHPVGRAENLQNVDLFLHKGIPKAKCPSSILSVSAFGNFMPCCNTASHLEGLKLGHIREDNIVDVYKDFISDEMFRLLREYGPHIFIEKASTTGFEVSEEGYLDQCHLCHELFKSNKIANFIKSSAGELYQEIKFNELINEFQINFENPVIEENRK